MVASVLRSACAVTLRATMRHRVQHRQVERMSPREVRRCRASVHDSVARAARGAALVADDDSLIATRAVTSQMWMWAYCHRASSSTQSVSVVVAASMHSERSCAVHLAAARGCNQLPHPGPASLAFPCGSARLAKRCATGGRQHCGHPGRRHGHERSESPENRRPCRPTHPEAQRGTGAKRRVRRTVLPVFLMPFPLRHFSVAFGASAENRSGLSLGS